MPWEKAHESLAIRAMENSCETLAIEKTTQHNTNMKTQAKTNKQW